MALAGGNEVNQVHAEVLNLSVRLVANVRLCLWNWSSLGIASISGNAWVDGADQAIDVAGDFLHSCKEV